MDRISIKLPTGTVAWLTKRAAERQTNVSTEIREAIALYQELKEVSDLIPRLEAAIASLETDTFRSRSEP